MRGSGVGARGAIGRRRRGARGRSQRGDRVPPCVAVTASRAVELLGAIPLLLIVVLAAAELLAAGAARVSASSAANAAAMALLQGGDPPPPLVSAAPGWAHPHIAVRVSGRHARVRLTPPSLLPGLSGLLSTTAEADAGPSRKRAPAP